MKVIIATDGTKQSAAIPNAIESLKLAEGDLIIAVTVIDMALPFSVDLYASHIPSPSEAESNATEHAEKVLSESKATLEKLFGNNCVSITTRVLFGTPDRRIVELAEEEAADLIVVGSHGYNRLERLLLGSVSDAIVHHAPCKVLVVRDKNS